MFKVVDVRTEYQVHPLGIDVSHPRLSWRLDSDQSNVLQRQYEVEVYEDRSFTKPVWMSGPVVSDQSVHVVYQGEALRPRHRYFVRVRAWDQRGDASDWTIPTYFETGMGEPESWHAQWITADRPETMDPVSPLLRKTFVLTEIPETARIYATGLGLYELYLNGERIGDQLFTPGWTSYHHRLQYQTYDVSGLLRTGTNVLGAVLGNGWYRGELVSPGHRALWGKQRALLLEGYGGDAGGTWAPFVLSDGTWLTHPGPILQSEIYDGETYDARTEIADWLTLTMDSTDWVAVETLEYDKGTLVAQENLPTRVTQTIVPIAVVKTPEGDTVLDFGQNLTGWVQFAVNAPRGTEVRLEHAEVLDHAGNFYTENLRAARQRVTYITRGEGTEHFVPHFTYQGFRYVRVAGFPDPIDPGAFLAQVIHTDLEATVSFACSNPMVNQLQKNLVWSQRGNFLEVPTDCPQRNERLGWTGDAQVFIGTAGYNMNVAPFFTKWLKDLAADQLPSGSVPHVVPHVLDDTSYGSAAWADAAVICPWTLYLHYGDRRILATQYPSMRAWVEYMRTQGPRSDMFSTGFHFGDWLGLDAAPGSYVGATAIDLIANAYYAYSTGILAKAAGVLGLDEDEATYTALHREIVAAFRSEYITSTGRLAVPTQTAHVLTLWFDLAAPDHQERIVHDLVGLIEAQKGHLTTGFVGTPYLLHALSAFGATTTAYQLLLQTTYPSWLYPITQGATTIWEHWDGLKPDGSFWNPDMNSFNHYAYGAVGDWLYQVVAGIRVTEDSPGFKAFVVQPTPGPGLDWVTMRYQSLYGSIGVTWRLEEQHFHLEVDVPANTEATVIFPHPTFSEFTTNVEIDGLRDGIFGSQIPVGSGHYEFSYTVR